MPTALSLLTWPLGSRDEAAAALARGAGLSGGRFDLQEVEADVSELEEMLRAALPALLAIRTEEGDGLLAVVRRHRSRLVVLAPDGAEHEVPLRAVAGHLRETALASAPPSEALLALAAKVAGGDDGRGRKRRQRMADELRGPVRVRGCWTLRQEGTWSDLARETRLWPWVAPFLGAHALQLGLWIAAWIVVAELAARADLGAPHFPALALVLGTMAACRAAETHAARRIALGAGTAVKRRLLDDSLLLGPDEVRRRGIGHYLARVLDAEAIETAGLTGAFLALDALGGIVVAAVVLGRGAGGSGHALSFVAWTALVAVLSGLVYVRRRRWTDTRLELTASGVEQMVGHQTRLAQSDPARRHDRDDALLDRYVAGRRAVDRATAATEMARRCWIYVGLLGLAGAFVGGASTEGAFVVSAGGVLLGYQALSNGTQSLARLSAAVIALRSLRTFAEGAAPPERPGGESRPAAADGGTAAAGGTPLLEVRDVSFAHAGRSAPVIRGAGLAIGHDDHVLLVGPSGSGKSTLAALLAGLRRPESGLVLLRGLDRDTVGSAGWRRAVALAPQFQDNHLLVGTLAYNLLLGRRWPATPGDLEEAAALCEELGLGPLLARMPLGLQQPVGETGWQLSHGERSRVFAARAILQRPDLLILDESFAALDPGTLARTIEIIRARSSAVMLIAHP